MPQVFDESDTAWDSLRARVRDLLDERAWSSARRSVINAHYTSAEVASAMWRLATALGFTGGRVLEPGCGSGNFIALAPATMPVDFVGVELDPTTARIARALHPAADIRSEGFEETSLAEGSVDLVIGNVPFGSHAPYDPRHNAGRHSIHNYFLVKSLRLTRPGGLVVAVTSRFTMDARSPVARAEIAEMADLVGALRLPAGALRAAAGTDAVVDLVVLRRRGGDQPPAGSEWLGLAPVVLADGEVEINEFFADHRQAILGELRCGGGQYRADDLDVRAGPRPLAEALDEAVTAMVDSALGAGLGWAPAGDRPALQAALHRPVTTDRPEGSILETDGGGFARVVGSVAQEMAVPANQRRELRALLGLRDTLGLLLDAQANTLDDAAFAVVQSRLNHQYDAYAVAHGPINRFSLVPTGRVHPTTGEATCRRLRPRMGGFVLDPGFHAVAALEVFDPDDQSVVKADIFSGRVLVPRQTRRGVETVEDALAVCLDEIGRPDLDVIAGLLGAEPEAARAGLGNLVWEDPGNGELVTASAYLSGNIRQKLAQAERAAGRDIRFEANAEALRAVLPVDLGPADIDARPGATWIPTHDVEAFIAEVLGCEGAVVDYADVTASWAVQVPSWKRRSVTLTSQWGTSRADGVSLLGCSLNQQPASVYDRTDEGGRVLNPAETLAAREKQEALEARFARWVWETPERADRLAARYNERFNAVVVPSHDGSHLTMPGLAASFAPHPHQRDAVWRILSEPTTLLAHAVGAGKTATMVMAAMELRRLGLAIKPAYVVPNHMLDQFATELLQLYPLAKVLVANRADASPAGRKAFVARCATGSWDGVVLTHSSFERIGVSDSTRRSFLERRLEEMRAAVAASKGLTVKRLEARMAALEERHKRLLAEPRKDDGLCFEATGIDYLFVDEAAAHKNLHFVSSIPGVGGEGSQRAEDLALKLEYLRSRHGERVATFATATPVANSLSELYVMQTYLQPEALATAGVAQFDAWAATFARTVNALELAPDGGSYRLKTRFARFRNLPELLTMFRSTADVRTPDQLDLPRPEVDGGRPETIVVPASPGLSGYVSGLVDRAERVRNRAVRPDEDNMLKISGDGRRAALDLRLVGEAPDPAGGKLAAVADRVAAIHGQFADAAYLDTAGLPARRPGGFQLVFCDLGTPRDGEWSVYEELRGRLVDGGIAESDVRFIHDAKDDRAKAELFAGCRDGRVRVLIGSTEKMGVGTNVQRRLVALHHLDCPWRPADIEQREGRALRQGNQNPSVQIVRYVTEGSFDVFMWQTVERKAGFIHQVMQGTSSVREIDDVGEQALSYAEVKALATGNPLIMEKAGVDNEVARLTRLRRSHEQDQSRLASTLATSRDRASRLDEQVRRFDAAIAQRIDTRGDRFAMEVERLRHVKRVDAGVALKAVLVGMIVNAADDRRCVASLGGFPVVASTDGSGLVNVALRDAPIRLPLSREELLGSDPAGLVQRLEHRLRGLEDGRDDAAAESRQLRREADAAEARLGLPFEHQARLDHLRSRQAEIERTLSADAEGPPLAPDAAGAATMDSVVHYLRPARSLGRPPGRGMDL